MEISLKSYRSLLQSSGIYRGKFSRPVRIEDSLQFRVSTSFNRYLHRFPELICVVLALPGFYFHFQLFRNNFDSYVRSCKLLAQRVPNDSLYLYKGIISLNSAFSVACCFATYKVTW